MTEILMVAFLLGSVAAFGYGLGTHNLHIVICSMLVLTAVAVGMKAVELR